MSGSAISEEAVEAARQALGQRIRELRGQRDLSQEEASLRAGITPRSWSRIEHAQLNPRLDTLFGIQVALELDTLDALFGPTTGDLIRSA
jgi:transcriptional regulator with XRE-family HTH domain